MVLMAEPLERSLKDIPYDILGKVMLVDFLAYREALENKGINQDLVQPDVPVDVVIDHSLQVDYFGSDEAKIKNLQCI